MSSSKEVNQIKTDESMGHAILLANMESEAAERALKSSLIAAVEKITMATIAAVTDITERLAANPEAIKSCMQVLETTKNGNITLHKMLSTIDGGQSLSSRKNFAVSGDRIVQRNGSK